MAGRLGQRLTVALVCTVCGARNYKASKQRRAGAAPLQLRKHCKTCNVHTVHIETK